MGLLAALEAARNILARRPGSLHCRRPLQAPSLNGQTGPFPGNPEPGGDAALISANSFPVRVQQFLDVFCLSLRARGVGPFGFEAVGALEF